MREVRGKQTEAGKKNFFSCWTSYILAHVQAIVKDRCLDGHRSTVRLYSHLQYSPRTFLLKAFKELEREAKAYPPLKDPKKMQAVSFNSLHSTEVRQKD